jgi:hypothetical protein
VTECWLDPVQFHWTVSPADIVMLTGEKTPPMAISATSCTLTLVVAACVMGGALSASNANIEATTDAAAQIATVLITSHLLSSPPALAPAVRRRTPAQIHIGV